jgi:hypothetical protein
MGHYGYQDHDRAAEEAASQMDAEMQAANDLAMQAANDEAMQAACDEAMSEDARWIELERKWQEAHCADITHTMAFSDGLATARKMLLTVEQAHRASCDAYNAYGADQAPKTWGEWCFELLTRAVSEETHKPQ